MVAGREIDQAVGVLRAGGLVALPTETVYGLGADAENEAAVGRVFTAKGRPRSHPLIVHLESLAALPGWVAEVPPAAEGLARRFWPGPLTLLLRRSQRVSRAVTGGLDTVAVRVPDHPVALALLAAFGGGIVAPSANRFGSVSPTTAAAVRAELGPAVDLVLDGGPCRVGVESTIVDLTGDQPSVLRPGGVTREELEDVLGGPVAVPATSTVRVPGQHPSHYAPQARVILVEPGQVVAEAASAQAAGQRVGVLLPPSAPAPSAGIHCVVRVPDSLAAYARQLYGFLRAFDDHGCDVIIAAEPEPSGLGLAIANRLQRAAGPRTSPPPSTTGR